MNGEHPIDIDDTPFVNAGSSKSRRSTGTVPGTYTLPYKLQATSYKLLYARIDPDLAVPVGPTPYETTTALARLRLAGRNSVRHEARGHLLVLVVQYKLQVPLPLPLPLPLRDLDLIQYSYKHSSPRATRPRLPCPMTNTDYIWVQ
jgi:hypothetical protein